MNSLLNITVALSLETLGFGGQVVLIGMATIFAVLTILMFALKLFEMIFAGTGKSKNKKEAAAPVAEEVLPAAASDNTEEIVAVIAAAIAAAEAESPALKFRVVSFKRK